jgi:polar amino acid transport system substrate-binding protein
MQTRWTSLAGTAAMALTLTFGASAHAADFTIAALKGWPPFSGKELPNKGFSNDVTQTALERMGHSATIRVMPWARALEMTKRGKFEVLPSVWYSDERAKKLKFTDPIASNRIVFIKNKNDTFEFDGVESLTGKSVGIVQDYDYSDKFLSAENFERQKANSLKINLRKLLGGRVDLTLGDEFVAKYAMNKNMPDRADQVAYTEGALSEKDLHVTFSRKLDNVDNLVKNFNQELEAMREDGTYDDILERHKLK